MTDRKQIKSSRYVAAFAITIIIFLVGYLIGSYIQDQKLQTLITLEQDIRVDSLGNELAFTLVQQDLCDSVNYTSYTQELSAIGTRLVYLESQYGYDAPEVAKLKEYYSLLELRHWMLIRETNKVCDLNRPTVVFFYTNYGCVDCEDQGLVLTNIHKNYPLFFVYSFEYALENPALDFMKKRYRIEAGRLPTIIVDNETLYGFQSKDEIIVKMRLEERLAQEKQAHPEWYPQG